MTKRLTCWLLVVAVWGTPAIGGTYDSGSDGSDGAFNPVASVEVDLSMAIPGDALTTPGTGDGVYDASRWAVVFKYTTIDIPAGVTVTFKNHASCAPVVWLATGDVTIAGTVNFDGEAGGGDATPPFFPQPGPGGFAGGRGGANTSFARGSGGFGPGGGYSPPGGGGATSDGGGGGFSAGGASGSSGGSGAGGPAYGNEEIVPLLGGSGGGAADNVGGDGGAGGGAVVIASSTAIDLQAGGFISANGGNGGNGGSGGSGLADGGGGSGGSIRLIADDVVWSGALSADNGISGGGGSGANGRVRVEFLTLDMSGGSSNPAPTTGGPGAVFPPANAPTLSIVSVDSVAVPVDPSGGIETGDLEVDNGGAVVISISATQIPVTQENIFVTVIIVPRRGDKIEVLSDTALIGNLALSTTTATVTLPPGSSEMQLRANWTP